jgi:hypothetical protein
MGGFADERGETVSAARRVAKIATDRDGDA